MDIPNLFALTTQTKPSSFLANALPSKPLEGLENSVGSKGDIANILRNSDDTDGITTREEADVVQREERSEQAEEFTTFLTLLTAQIRNQDPLAPLDSTQFVEQLATFTNLELQAKSNDILENISDMLAQNIYSQEQSLNGEDV